VESRGIVFTAGGPVYFLNAYINVCLLRELGCTLPVEWFYLGAEMRPEWIEAAGAVSGVRLRNLGGDRAVNTKDGGGWQSKIEAILQSDFADVLFLDADCFPLRDPAYLFDHAFFRGTGAVLWPDPYCWSASGRRHLKELYGVDVPARQVESGQMMFNKGQCLEGLLRVQALNRDSAGTYRHVYGDKDTFLIGLLQAGAAFRVNPHPVEGIQGGMLQKDFEGAGMFCHLTGGKFQWHGRPFVKRRDYPHADRAAAIVQAAQRAGLGGGRRPATSVAECEVTHGIE